MTNRKQHDEEEAGKTPEKVSVTRNRVIYPDNYYIRFWDALMLFLIFVYAFTVPYQLGVSAGVQLIKSVGWFIITVCMNTCFFIDTFLHFFRAYRDTKGRMVIDPKSIRKNYLRTLFFPNLMSNLPTTIIFYIYGQSVISGEKGNFNLFESESQSLMVLLKFSDILKLLRLGRAQRLLSSSEFVREFREHRKAYTIRLWVFVFLIVMAAHWFACIWSFVAFVQVGGFGADMLKHDNWIANWYRANPGPLNPIGWDHHTDRYVLSLFWAIQTITSIGYGNIVPFTRVEWWIGSVLQLMAGILWAYIIGGLVGVVTAMEVRNEAFRDRIDKANDLISVFLPNERKKNQTEDCAQQVLVAKQIRRYIYNQNERSRSAFRYASNFEQAFPVMDSLSPSLQHAASLMVIQKNLERVPYLSSRFLSRDEQSLVARQCLRIEFPCGEVFQMKDGVQDNGRGILVQVDGLVVRSSNIRDNWPIVSRGVFGEGQVLLEDEHPGVTGKINMLSFSNMMFIPREAILAALARNPAAWTECARWKLIGAGVVAKAICVKNEKKSENSKSRQTGVLGMSNF